MAHHTVLPHGRWYWIQVTNDDGSRHLVERFDNEYEAVRRLRVLQENDAAVERQRGGLPPRSL